MSSNGIEVVPLPLPHKQTYCCISCSITETSDYFRPGLEEQP